MTSGIRARAKREAPQKDNRENVVDNIILAYEFADNDVYRAVTHNKGIMNGVDIYIKQNRSGFIPKADLEKSNVEIKVEPAEPPFVLQPFVY